MNGSKPPEEQERARLHMRNGASDNYLTPFQSEGMKQNGKKRLNPGDLVYVTDYSYMIDPLLD